MAFEELLFRLNPWWSKKEDVPLPEKLIKRDGYLTNLKNLLSKPEALLLTGVRRSGKTTLMFSLLKELISSGAPPKDILYLSADDPEISLLFKEEFLPEVIKTFQEIRGRELKREKVYVFLDEIQYLKHWQRWIKKYYDQTRIKFILSGSSATLIKESAVELTGRKTEVKIWPLSFKELVENKWDLKLESIDLASKNAIISLYKQALPFAEGISIFLPNYIRCGGFPRVQGIEKAERGTLLKEYFEDILYKDIIKIYSIKDPVALENIATYLLENIGQKFSFRKISKVTDVDVETVKKYIHYLEESHLFFLVPYFSGSLKGSIQKEKKIYLIDSGLRSAFALKEAEGHLMENLVFSQLINKGHDLCYWQTKEGYECDFVLRDRKLPIEVKYSKRIEPKDLKGILAFLEKHKGRGLVLTKDQLKFEDRLFYVPAWLFCLF